jgi:hypothetical protein
MESIQPAIPQIIYSDAPPSFEEAVNPDGILIFLIIIYYTLLSLLTFLYMYVSVCVYISLNREYKS